MISSQYSHLEVLPVYRIISNNRMRAVSLKLGNYELLFTDVVLRSLIYLHNTMSYLNYYYAYTSSRKKYIHVIPCMAGKANYFEVLKIMTAQTTTQLKVEFQV